MSILKNISVRTLIVSLMSILTLYSFIPILFSFNNIEKLYFYGTIPYIILCFTFFFLFYLSVFLVNPILNIQKTLKEIGNGNINIKINLFGKNCAGKLIPEIIKMQESIINIIQQISYTNSNISEDISNIVHENKNLKIKTENESKHITSMTIITEKVNNAFYKNNELSIEARTIIDNAIVSLNNGKKNMDLMVENIETINEKSKNIMEISNFINDISFKTNILALNSAIEASRAGVNKGGFSVIAKEIRELSNICQNYATDIKNIVKISQGQILVTKSLNEKNKDNIQNIYNEVNKVSNSIDTILKSSNIQLSEIKDINKVLLVINKDVKDNILLSDKNINLSEKIKEKINNLTIYIGNIYS